MKTIYSWYMFTRVVLPSSIPGAQSSCGNGSDMACVRRMLLLFVALVLGCSSTSITTNYSPDAEPPWSPDSNLGGASAAVGTSSRSMGGSSTVATGGSSAGYEATGGTQSSVSLVVATGGASSVDLGACPCPQNPACSVLASGCNVPGTKGDAGNETFTCVESRLQCPTAARPVFCFSC